MFFEWMADPAAWAGLATLIVLEIVLGIDNLVFIAILADKLPPHQREKARMIGLTLALVMRLGLLASVAWIVTLTEPLFAVAGWDFSGRDLILIFGGAGYLYGGLLGAVAFRVMQDFLGGITPQYWLFYVGLVLVLLVLFVRGGIIGMMMAGWERITRKGDTNAGGRP